jgi:hypothetical protein
MNTLLHSLEQINYSKSEPDIKCVTEQIGTLAERIVKWHLRPTQFEYVVLVRFF